MSRLRRARERDVAELDALDRSLYTSDIVDAAEWRARLKRRTNEVWVAEDEDGLVCSLLLVHGKQNTRVEGIQVAKRVQGQGWGRRLLRHAVRRAEALGKERVTLEVASRNTRAEQVYASFGFKRRGSIPGYYEDGDSAIRMTYELAD
ncbi:MAG: GNAT family N-acetyltransferase [Euryarchaeota archaeon]|nr:GNAT family N-acetyltransferase [Euryarchaeota archaeon]